MGNLALIPSRNRKIYLAFFISIIFALSCLYLEIDLLEMILGFPTFVSFFIHKFIPPAPTIPNIVDARILISKE